MEEESAIDVIFELRDLVKNQTQRIVLLEKNIAMMNTRLNSKLHSVVQTNLAPKAKDIVVKPKPAKTPPPIKSTKNVRVFGHLEDNDGKKLGGVEVHIKDSKDRLIKTTKSNRAGMYMAFLPPGQYTAEFNMPGMQAAFRVFKLLPGQKEVEIA
jgi:hypothetical protein